MFYQPKNMFNFTEQCKRSLQILINIYEDEVGKFHRHLYLVILGSHMSNVDVQL